MCAPPLGGEARLDADPGVLVCAGDSAAIDSNGGSTVECAPPLRGEARLDVNLGVRVSAGDSAVVDLNAGSDSRTS